MPKSSKTTQPARVSRSTARTSTAQSRTTAIKDSQVMTEKPAYTSRSGSNMRPALTNKQIYIALAVAVVAGLLYYFRGMFVVAMVNGTPVTRLEVVKELETQGGRGALDGIISENLLRQEAKKKGVTVDQKEVNDRIKAIEEELKSSGQSLDQVLEAQGITREQVEEQTELQLLLKKLLADKIKVTDEEVEKTFEEQKESMPEGMIEAEFKTQIRESLENQKLSFEAQAYIQKLQSEAKIQYIHNY